MDITFNCDMCGQPLAIDEAGAGQLVDCPKCGTRLVVPNKFKIPDIDIRVNNGLPAPQENPLPVSDSAVPVYDPALFGGFGVWRDANESRDRELVSKSVTRGATIKSNAQQSAGSPSSAGMKKCPLCAEEIRAEAVKCKHCGELLDATRLPKSSNPQLPPESEKKKTSVGMGCLLAFLVLILIFLGVPMLSILFNTERAQRIQGSGNADEAYYMAIEFVPKYLKAPSTAKFCGRSEAHFARDGSTWEVTGWVDAQNSFGAMIRQNFRCRMTYDGKWKCEGVTFE